MKTIYFSIFGIAVIVISLLLSCYKKVEGGGMGIYTYINKSGHNIEIVRYLKGNTKKFFINNNDSMSNKTYMFFGDASEIIYFADSVSITFDDDKNLFYRRLQKVEHNPLYPESYEITHYVKGKTPFYALRFTFTEQDYLNAK